MAAKRKPVYQSDLVCEFDGCENGPANGHGLYRTNPQGKGQGFKGRCSLHMGEPVDPIVADIVGDIEEENRRNRRRDS